MATTTLHPTPTTNLTMLESSLPVHRHLADPLPHLKRQVGLHSLQKSASVSETECSTNMPVSVDAKNQADFEAEKAAVQSYEEGIDDHEGPIWRDPLDPKAVAAQMKEIHPVSSRQSQCVHEECEGWENWEKEDDEDDEGMEGDYDDSVDSMEGPVWIDPHAPATSARQMSDDSDLCNDQEESWDPAWFEEQPKPEDSIFINDAEEIRNPDAWFEGDDETMWEFRPTKKTLVIRNPDALATSTTGSTCTRQQPDRLSSHSASLRRNYRHRRHSDGLSRNQELFREAAGVDDTVTKHKFNAYRDVNRGAW